MKRTFTPAQAREVLQMTAVCVDDTDQGQSTFLVKHVAELLLEPEESQLLKTLYVNGPCPVNFADADRRLYLENVEFLAQIRMEDGGYVVGVTPLGADFAEALINADATKN